MFTSAIPELGQIVAVRQRNFVVTDVHRSDMPVDAVAAYPLPTQHLVTLASIEEDALGEALRVVWELEPGTRIFQKSELPKPAGLDDPVRLDAFLDAARWGASSTADVRNVQSPFRSGIEIEDYQLDPVVRAVQMHRVNLLIADDVGLGKTIETGLVIQELLFRHRIRKALIVCPSNLQIQWRDQMRDKFGLEFRIIDGDAMKNLRRTRGIHVNPWNHFPRLITSMDFLKRERPLRLFRELLPAEGEPAYPRRFDLLVVDEAHNIAPSGSQYYAVDSLRTEMIRALAPHFEHRLFLTATPHNGYKESFTALLELLDAQRFARGVPPDHNQLETVMVRRLKTELPPKWDGTPRFPVRRLEAISVNYTAEEVRAHEMLREYTKQARANASTALEKFSAEFVLKLLKKRLFSSPAAFATTLAQHAQTIRKGRQTETLPANLPASLFERQIEQSLTEEFANDEEYENAADDAVTRTSAQLQPVGESQHQLLAELLTWSAQAAERLDSKARELIRRVKEIVRPANAPESQWTNQRVIIFTEYRTTQKWLFELFVTEGMVAGDRLMTLYGGMQPEERERIKAAFQAHPDEAPVRILLATDAASEGLDLQNHCDRLIHYEIPWNPNRMEQRNGRIDRHGQRSPEVFVYHFVGKAYVEQQHAALLRPGNLDGDLEFLMRAALKVQSIRQDLGKVGPVIAKQIEEAMLGKSAQLDTGKAERESEAVRRMLRFERKVHEQIERLKAQLHETRKELRLAPDHIETVVRVGLELAKQMPLIPADVPGLSGRAFTLPAFSGSWAACSEGLAHPHTGKRRPVVFDPDLARGRDDVVLIHLNHKLVRMCLGVLRAEVWSTEHSRKLNRVTARVVSNDALEFPALVAYGRLVVLGADQQRLHEEIITAGGMLREGRFNRMNVGEVEKALDAALPEMPAQAMQTKLIEVEWDKHASSLMQSLEARMRTVVKGLEKKLQDRATSEISNITQVLTELQKSILQELETPEETEQLSFFAQWSEEEKDQRERDVLSLRLRLERIPAEIEQETAAINRRFASPEPRLFPLAACFLIPKRFAQ